jgi:hypothetical protein
MDQIRRTPRLYDLSAFPELEQLPGGNLPRLDNLINQFYVGMRYLNPDHRPFKRWQLYSSNRDWIAAHDAALTALMRRVDARGSRRAPASTRTDYLREELFNLARHEGLLLAAKTMLRVAGEEGEKAFLLATYQSTDPIKAVMRKEWARDAALMGVAHTLRNTRIEASVALFTEIKRTRFDPWEKGYGVVGSDVPAKSVQVVPFVYYARPKGGRPRSPVRPANLPVSELGSFWDQAAA